MSNLVNYTCTLNICFSYDCIAKRKLDPLTYTQDFDFYKLVQNKSICDSKIKDQYCRNANYINKEISSSSKSSYNYSEIHEKNKVADKKTSEDSSRIEILTEAQEKLFRCICKLYDTERKITNP